MKVEYPNRWLKEDKEDGERQKVRVLHRWRELEREWGGKEARSDRVEVKKECYAR